MILAIPRATNPPPPAPPPPRRAAPGRGRSGSAPPLPLPPPPRGSGSGGGSAPLPLPASHVRRTRSEQDLEASALQAEHEDHRMYARLWHGMYGQMRLRSVRTGGYVHPLSWKSLEGVWRTKMTTTGGVGGPDRERRARAADDGWDFSHEGSVDDDLKGSFSTWSTLARSPGSRDSLFSLHRDVDPDEAREQEEEQEDECVFSLEL